jgi:hypothetical protein
MASTTLEPDSDISGIGGSDWSIQGGSASASAALSDGSDSTYIQTGSNNVAAVLRLQTPSDSTFDVATAVTVNVRAEKGSGKFGPVCTVQIFQSGGVTTLTNTVSQTFTTSIANYAITMTLTGTQNLAAWTNAQIQISNSLVTVATYVLEINVAVTYSQTSPDTDDSGTLGSGGMSTMEAAAWLVTQDRETTYIAYRLRPEIWLPERRLILPVRRAG